MNGKEFKEEILKMEERNDRQRFFAIEEENKDKLIELMHDNKIPFQQYEDSGLAFADKEGTTILNNKIQDGTFNIPDDLEIKVSPVTFVNTFMNNVYDQVICEDTISNAISNEIENIVNQLADKPYFL